MPNYIRRKCIVYLIGIFTLAIGSNLFLNAALGVAPSCSLALTLTFLLPGSYALYNFIVNSLILILESLIVRKFGKTQIIQFIITFIYSYLIKLTSFILRTSFISYSGLYCHGSRHHTNHSFKPYSHAL